MAVSTPPSLDGPHEIKMIDPPAGEPADTGQPSRRGRGRLVGIDIARAIALIGMFTQHVYLGGEGGESTGLVAWFFNESAGRASVLFFVLSGVSLSLIARRNSASAAPGALYRRGTLLLTGGILLTVTIWSASILQHYGVAFLLAPLLLRLRSVRLAAVATAGLIAGPVLLLFATNWSNEVAGLLQEGTGNWLITNVWDILVAGIYPMVLWIGFFALGMLIGRIELGSRRNLIVLALGAVVAATLVGNASSALTERFGSPDIDQFDDKKFDDKKFDDKKFDEKFDEKKFFDDEKTFDESKFDDTAFYPETPPDWRALYDVAGHSGRIGWTLQTGAMAIALMAVALLLPGAVTKMLAPLAWMGSMSLTAYLVHIVMVTDVFTPIVEEADWSIVTKELFFGAMVFGLITICAVFHRLLGVGPLEWLLKQFTVPRRPTPVSGSPVADRSGADSSA